MVVYLSDFSIQGYQDPGFGTSFAWDEPLLEGYRSQVLNANSKHSPQSFIDLKAPGWSHLLKVERPTRLLVTTLNYQGAISAVLRAKSAGIPCTLRVETNDEALSRNQLKNIGRSLIYKSLYAWFDSAIAIGSLNRQHLVKHGIPADKVRLAYYCVPDRFQHLSLQEKQGLRQKMRQQLGFTEDKFVVLFCGKLISKKNPELLLQAAMQIPEAKRKHIVLLYVGSGTLEKDLQTLAANTPELKIHFAGFRNQLELPPYYLASDAMVLPSNRQGETWGLVVNEALQAGLPCIVTDAVGCSTDFSAFPNFQVIPELNLELLAEAIAKIVYIPRDFERYQLAMKDFSIQHCSNEITSFLLGL
ncbi:MAG: glycosyltransferase family 4 protein [Nostocaceae cyanobacterium]|nr:glycosyltransferase family 4 protein [Nostocaceae cyanobacterium]